MMRVKLAALLLACLMALVPCAWGEEDPFDLPPSGSSYQSAEAGSIRIEINGQPMTLAFDGSEEYSTLMTDTVQASFYAYSDDSEMLYELYIIFPRNVRPGDMITPDYALEHSLPDCSVVFIVSNRDSEQYFFAGQIDGQAYPNASGYSIRIDSAETVGSASSYSGSITASLGFLDRTNESPLASFSISDAPFSFTISDTNEDPGDGSNPFSDDPQPSIAPFGGEPDVPVEPFDSFATPAPETFRV